MLLDDARSWRDEALLHNAAVQLDLENLTNKCYDGSTANKNIIAGLLIITIKNGVIKMTTRRVSIASNSGLLRGALPLCPSASALGTLPVHLATSQGTAVRALTSVALRADSQMDDLHLMDERRRGLKGESEVLARFFAVRDVRMPKRFQGGWMAATPSLSRGTQCEEGCFFTAGPFGYRLTLASSLLSISTVKSFCEDRARIGLGISYGQRYVTVTFVGGFRAIALLDARRNLVPAPTLPSRKLAHGNALMLQLIDAPVSRPVAARCLLLPAEFIAELRHHISRKMPTPRRTLPKYNPGLFSNEACIDAIESKSRTATGTDSPVFGAWVSEATACKLTSELDRVGT